MANQIVRRNMISILIFSNILRKAYIELSLKINSNARNCTSILCVHCRIRPNCICPVFAGSSVDRQISYVASKNWSDARMHRLICLHWAHIQTFISLHYISNNLVAMILLRQHTIFKWSIWTDRPEQTVKVLIRHYRLQCLIRVYTLHSPRFLGKPRSS